MAVRRAILLSLLAVTLVSAQSAPRRATNLATLLAFPAFYHQRPIVLVARVSLEDNGTLKARDESGSVLTVFKGNTPDGPAEIRGELWDLGRMHADDAHLAGYDLKATFHVDPDAPWPAPGKVLVLIAASMEPAQPPPAPSIRNIVLFPSRYSEQRVTVTGQFGGRNLLGDLPEAPAQSKYDFVLRSADAAIWVTHIRPKGKDFDLALDAKIDTGRWLEVTGMIKQARGLQWLEAEAGTLASAKAPIEKPIQEQIRAAPAPPPEVVFSAPNEGETDVELGSSIRIQFSRDLNPATLKGHVHATYVPRPGRPEAEIPLLTFATQYIPANRVLEVKFGAPLEQFRTVRLDLLDGIFATDKQPLAAWSLTFETGEK